MAPPTEIKQNIESLKITVWKFQDFSVIQILREINFDDSRSSKSAFLTNLEALDFDYNDFLHFLQAEICSDSGKHEDKNLIIFTPEEGFQELSDFDCSRGNNVEWKHPKIREHLNILVQID